MSMYDVKCDEVRKILLSLLLARPGATSVTVLDRDYYEMEGEHIPWRKFGHADVVEFLQSMPEYFLLEWNNGGYYVRGIASEKTKHVSSLVSRQKSTKSKYIPFQFRYRPSFVNRYIPQMQRQRVRIPAEQLSYLVTYVKNNPNGVSLQNVMLMLQNQLPHITFSIRDIKQQLRELEHSLYLNNDIIYPMPVNNVSQDVKNYPQPSISESQNMSRLPVMETMCAGGDEGSDLEDINEEDCILIDYVNCSKQSKMSERLGASFAQNITNKQSTVFNHNDDIDINKYYAVINNSENTDTITANYDNISSLISDRMKSRLDQLVRKYPEGIWCAHLPDKYLEEYKVSLNYSELGFSSVREYVSYLPDIFYMTRVNSTDDFLLYSADKRPIVPDQEMTKIELIKMESSSYGYDEYNAVQTQCGNDNDSAPIPADVSPTITQTFAPDDVMSYNDSVSQIPVTNLQRDRKYLEVYVVEIFNPSFFWIHLRENRKHFNQFMDKLHTFYHYNKDKYTIPKIALQKGLNCACIYANKWHRGIIKSVKPDFKVTVMFYDYGTLKTYAPEDVYYLHKQFSFLSAQAIPCGLYNVRPCVGDRWKKSVIKQLDDKINETLLALTIVSIDPSNNSMMVILSDTSEEEDVHINDWLINEKLARCGKMGDVVDMTSIMKYVVNNLNQLPTYCFAEESLMSDSHCKAISTEEMPEKISLASSKQTYYDNLEQHSVRSPPGFSPLAEIFNLSNMLTKSFSDTYSFKNASNVKTSTCNAEVTTNPFLSEFDEKFVNDNIISNNIAKQIFTPIWRENVQLFINLTKTLCAMLERSPLNKSIFENHITIQYHLNKFLKTFEEKLSEKISENDRSMIDKSSTSLLAKETMPDKIGYVEKTPTNSNTENAVNQKLAGMSNLSLSNSFDDDRSLQTYNTFSNSNDCAFITNWHQSDGFNSHVSSQVPSTSACSTNYKSSAATVNVFFPNVDQDSENSTSKLISPVSMNTVSNNHNSSSNFFNNIDNEFTNMFKETNPFKVSMINDMQTLEKQNEQKANNYDTNSALYLSVKNPYDHSSKMEASKINIHTGNNGFITAEHLKPNGAENHTFKLVHESDPIMYNTQKKQTDVNMKHSTCNTNFKNVFLKEHCENNKDLSKSANDITLYSKHDNSYIDAGCTTQSPTTYMLQNSHLIINNELNYHQQNDNIDNNKRISFPQTWEQIETPKCWINSQLQNDASLQNHNEKSKMNTLINSPYQNRNCNHNEEFVTQDEMNEMFDISYIFQWNDKEKQIDRHKNFCNNPSIENQKSIECKNVNFFFDISFVFQKIDAVKNMTFVFHTEGEGWMLTYEFVNIFTNFKLCSHLMFTLETMNIKATFKEIQRSDYPIQFSQLDHYSLNVPRDSNNCIVSIHLISLQTALSLLYKLKIVTREEIDDAFRKKKFSKNSILFNMWMLIVVYRDLKQRIEQCKL